jgi:hypothetical protein
MISPNVTFVFVISPRAAGEYSAAEISPLPEADSIISKRMSPKWPLNG